MDTTTTPTATATTITTRLQLTVTVVNDVVTQFFETAFGVFFGEFFVQFFYRPDALPVSQPTVSVHWKNKTMITISEHYCNRFFLDGLFCL